MRHLLCFLLISYFILSKNKVHIGVAKKSGKVYRIETIGGKNEHSNGGVRSQTDEYGMNYEDDVSWVKYEKDKQILCILFSIANRMLSIWKTKLSKIHVK